MLGEVNQSRSAKIGKRTGHVPDDHECRYWAGDYAGIDFKAKCYRCRDGLDDDLPGPDPERARHLAILWGSVAALWAFWTLVGWLAWRHWGGS